jgi:thiosulfate/3-mercaptopyruvate sulfurtransferase
MDTTDPLVSTAWLAAHLDDGDLRVLDCTVILEPQGDGGLRAVAGRGGWAESHIPGSAFADLIVDLSDPDSPLRFTLPAADRFAAAMGRLGVGVGTRVVLYDGRLNMWAARLWWMLRAFGFDDAAVLDGGWRAWTAEGRPTSTEPSRHPPAVFHARPRPGLFVGRDEVVASLDDGATCLVNALSGALHRGDQSAYARPGHIPGSRNVPAADLVDPETHRYLAEAALRERFAPVLDPAVGRVVTYCGGGIAASSDAFALWRLGKRDVAVYDASLQEWAADPSLPLALGDGDTAA